MEPCELYCTDTDDTVIVPWGESVMDGTPCNVGTRDMCINGICKVRKIIKFKYLVFSILHNSRYFIYWNFIAVK